MLKEIRHVLCTYLVSLQLIKKSEFNLFFSFLFIFSFYYLIFCTANFLV